MRTCFHGGRRKDEILPWDEMTDERVDKKASPTQVAVIGKKKKVIFCTDKNQVIEYENEFTKDDIGLLWYEEENYDAPEDFRIIQKSASSTSAQESVRSICYNHTRRVLLNYACYRGMNNGCELLRNISRSSSRARRKEARRQAVSLSKALKTLERPLYDDILHEFGLDSRMADYYFLCLADKLMAPNWLCGALWTTE